MEQSHLATPADSSDERWHLPITVPFRGSIGATATESVPHYPLPPRAPVSAPNVIVILLDDVGFGQPGPFGGPVEMQCLADLRREGLSYTRFHTTALCSPTRAAVLTGKNQHSLGHGAIPEIATGFPGYDSLWPRHSASIAEILNHNGYRTAAFGKWHNTPEWESGPAGPFHRWPTGVGFEYFYGFLAGDCSQWEPSLYENTTPIDAPARPVDGYHLDRDLSDRASTWLRRQTSLNPDDPFFLYYAPGTAHAPHHAPESWIEKYRGQFDAGWDELRRQTFRRQLEQGIIPQDAVLTPRPPQLPSWDSHSSEQQQLAARYMEVFAGALDHCDHQIGRLLETVRSLGRDENTLVLYIAGDNGASADAALTGSFNKWTNVNSVKEDPRAFERRDEIGGPSSYNNYPAGWAWAGSTPHQWFKSIASHLGGTRNALVVRWPQSISGPAVRTQWLHCVDIVPTVLDCVGVPHPRTVEGVSQTPLDGLSFKATFGSDAAHPNAWSRRVQYFEVFGNRGVYQDEWLAGARHGRLPWEYAGGSSGTFDDDPWELYDLSQDFSQAHDVATDHPEKLREMRELWEDAANKYQVYPLDDRLGERMPPHHRPGGNQERTTFRYFQGTSRIPEGLSPNIKGRSHRITATFENREGTEGVLVAAGGRYAGYSLYIRDRRLTYAHNFCGLSIESLSTTSLPFGQIEVSFLFETDREEPGSGGTASLHCNDEVLATGRIERTVPRRYSYSETLDIGEDSGSSVHPEVYDPPYRFNSILNSVVIEILPDSLGDH